MSTVDELIGEVSAFERMRPEHLELIAGCGHEFSVPDGAYLLREGEAAMRFYVIRRGQVSLETFLPERGAVRIETLEEGDLLGWSWLVPPHRTQFDARALGVVRTVLFDGACLRGKAEGDPELGYELLKAFLPVIVERLQATRMRLLDLYGRGDGA